MKKVTQHVIPAVRVASYALSRPYYEKLGFRELWTHQFEPGHPVFAAIARGDMQIFLTEHVGDCAFGALVHFYVDDVDAVHAEFVRQGLHVTEPPGNDLGPSVRNMLMVDPDGNRLSFITVTEL
ncbi:glyoxalase superfamily protein [Methylobacillus flagellatus]|uniref:Bleomycin resistance protein n=1 Tax=Methylobacillus flagellatus (strain ATCC 51484 / DSM 6875 / VKM B-1610 / KT) TaxID=265072 RepID=Q1H2J3_METFK|nr:glyoxalase superfamily protein [Methylobacillus flagellatus]ABE49150.1 Glyoxalase/bleomycin resistance protein/dioxygenase [Methylobacillus flagellatus KT]ABE49294.1 Glyoxalase/bleomycin resistance protein/dioxygenase [Methylobacillus flagellatus KT]